MAKKMSKRLVALSSTAIVAVYGIGYALTEPAAASMATGQATPSASTSSSAASNDALPISAAPSTQSAQAANPQSKPAFSASILKDGSYSGTGWSRHGSVSVEVTIQNGRIASAPITGVTTRYSRSVIAGLPASVVSAQSSNIDLVSGATDSSTAYVEAVAQALAQAQGTTSTNNPNGSSLGAGSTVITPANGQGTTSVGGNASSVQLTAPNGTIYSSGGRRRPGTERD